MHHGQDMLAPVLTVQRNDPMTLSRHEETHVEENKETGNDHALPVSVLLWNCLDDASEFYEPANENKSWSHPRKKKE